MNENKDNMEREQIHRPGSGLYTSNRVDSFISNQDIKEKKWYSETGGIKPEGMGGGGNISNDDEDKSPRILIGTTGGAGKNTPERKTFYVDVPPNVSEDSTKTEDGKKQENIELQNRQTKYIDIDTQQDDDRPPLPWIDHEDENAQQVSFDVLDDKDDEEQKKSTTTKQQTAEQSNNAIDPLLYFQQQRYEEEQQRREESKIEAQNQARNDYLSFLDLERDRSDLPSRISKDNTRNAPDYFKGNKKYDIEGMTELERKEHVVRIQLLYAATAKDNANIDVFSNLGKEKREYSQIKNSELLIMEGIPGFLEARSMYIKSVEDNTPILLYKRNEDGEISPVDEEPKTWSELKAKDLEFYRLGMQMKLRDIVEESDRFKNKVAGLNVGSEEYNFQLDLMARSAEQVAHNFLYSQHFFEMNQSKWVDRGGNMVRTDYSDHDSTAISKALMGSLLPIDAYISDSIKDSVDVSKRFGRSITIHANHHIRAEASTQGVDLKDLKDNLDEVVVLENNRRNSDKFFKIKRKNNGKFILYTFSHIPRPKMSQMYMFESAKFDIDGSGNKTTVLDIMRDGNVVPWTDDNNTNLFSYTCDEAEKVGAYIKLVNSGSKLVSGTRGGGTNAGDWATAVNNSMSDIRFGDNRDYTGEIFRGILHASVDIDRNIVPPTIYTEPHVSKKFQLKLIETELTHLNLNSNGENFNYPWEPNVSSVNKSIVGKFIDRLLP